MRPHLIILAALLVALWPAPAPAASQTAVARNISEAATDTEATQRQVSLNVMQDASPEASASADADIYEGLEGNQVWETGGESLAHLADGFAGAMGIVSINQSPGSNNNQGNVVSFAYVDGTGGAALLARGTGEVVNRDNLADSTDTTRTNLIDSGAFNGFRGALQINQSSGNLNNQNNIVAIASGSNTVFSLSDAALGQQVAHNTVRDMAVIKHDVVQGGAFNNVSGLVSINQSSGCGNVQTNMIIISVQKLL